MVRLLRHQRKRRSFNFMTIMSMAPPSSPKAPQGGFSRRSLLQSAIGAGVGVWIAPLSSPAYAALFESRLIAPLPSDAAKAGVGFRIDGAAKVVGAKVFARDVRARDMAGWPNQQSHALILRAARADRIFTGFEVTALGADVQPDRVVAAADLVRDGLAFPSFYGDDMLLPEGKAPAYLGQALAILIFHDFARFRFARERLKTAPGVVRYGDPVEFEKREPWGVFRFVRKGGATPGDEDVYSSLKDAPLFPTQKKTLTWPKVTVEQSVSSRGMKIAAEMAERLEHPPADWLVMKRRYQTQSVDTAALEPDNANCWWDETTQSLHMVIASQSPQEVAESVPKMLADSRFPLKRLFVHPAYTVGYGSKDHSNVPYYGLVCALYADGRPVRLAMDRFEQFQSSLKRHSFDMDYAIAVDRRTGLFQSFKGTFVGNGGGRANFSPSVAMVAATAAQSIYYFPDNDLTAIAAASRAVDAGSARGYGTLQSMAATEMLVDEMAGLLDIDPIDFRLRNVLKSGMKNTQGAIPAGAVRADEVLERARVHPMWRDRHKRKSEFEAASPDLLYGVGFACVQKDFGTGGGGQFARIEISPQGRISLHHIGVEMGTGTATSQALVCARWLGRPAEEVQTGVTDWSQLPLVGEADTFVIKQDDQDRLSKNPRWTPVHASASSASNSAYFQSHATRETARVLFEHGLWPAAVAIWSQGIGGGQAAPYVLRMEDARWVEGRLTAAGMQPLTLEALAGHAYKNGLVTGATGHAFNRWQWAEADFDVGQGAVRRPLDALSVRRGAGQRDPSQESAAVRAAKVVDSGHAGKPEGSQEVGDGGGALQPASDGYSVIERRNVFYPPAQRNNAGVTYYSANAAIVEVAVHPASGKVDILAHHSIMECGTPIVPQLVSCQLQGGLAMGIGHALHEFLPLYEDGPGNGTWNFNRYRLPLATDVAVWNQTADILPPLSDTDPSKGIAEVAMIPIVGAIVNALAHATGHRFTDLPVTPEKLRAALTL